MSESVTLAIAARANELRQSGADIISLAAGQPDFAPPTGLRRGAIDWIDSGIGQYTKTSGRKDLLEVLAERARVDRGLQLTHDNVMVGSGTKPVLYQALLTLLEAGDEVLVLAPNWVSYPDIVRLAGGTPRILTATEAMGFRPDPEALAAEFARPRMRAVFFNSPNNPSGRVSAHEEVEALVAAAREHDVTILSDEIYRSISYDGEAASPSQFDPGLDSTLVFDGLSKSHAVPGWRLGWVYGPKDFITAIGKVQSQIQGNPSSILQAAACRAFEDETLAETKRMVEEFGARRRFVIERLKALPDVTLFEPGGAFYALPGFARVLERLGCDDVTLCQRLLEDTGVALVPGSAFGTPGHLRLSFAASMEQIETALDRVHAWLSERE